MSTIQVEQIEPQAGRELPPPPAPPALNISSLAYEEVEPVVPEPELAPAPPAPPAPPALAMSSILSESMEPAAAVEAAPIPLPLSVARVRTEEVEPRAEQRAQTAEQAQPISTLEASRPSAVQFSLSPVRTETIEPIQERQSLSLSRIQSQAIIPAQRPGSPSPVLSVSNVESQQIEPVSPTDRPDFRAPPALGISAIKSIESEPVEQRSPKRDAIFIPRDHDLAPTVGAELPRTPPNSRFGSLFGRNRTRGPPKAAESPVIAEDDTRQSLHSTPAAETPESQRPLKELSANTDVRPAKKEPVPTTDQSAQTSLTSEAIDEMFKADSRTRESGLGLGISGTPATVRRHKSRESLENASRPKGKMVDAGTDYFADAALPRRPGSSASGRASLHNAPPLPPNHKQAIEAARTGSSGGGQGTMGPPLFPASAYRNQNPSFRPMSPSSPHLQSSTPVPSGRGTPTPRAARLGSSHGVSDLHSLPRAPTRLSRRSSVSSFVSELDSRFNIQSDMGMAASDFGTDTDPRMIRAITETMIGEYLWKYTRKTGRGELSENRHRRYFWVHPYTRTLYWSERDPTSGGLRAKSIPIEAVRVVTDDNPMPPGLHRKSLVVISPARTIKLTCTTGQRHETWFNALSYLLLRAGDEGQTDVEELAGHLTREDVEEFNPGFNRRPANGARPAVPPSLSSYPSRSARNESPAMGMSMNVPTLTPTHEKPSQSRASLGTLGRISGYWKDNKVMSGTFSSLRNRSVNGRSRVFDADEAHDSAEDLRAMIERQDREADRLENVRACCDGKTLPFLFPPSSPTTTGHYGYAFKPFSPPLQTC